MSHQCFYFSPCKSCFYYIINKKIVETFDNTHSATPYATRQANKITSSRTLMNHDLPERDEFKENATPSITL